MSEPVILWASELIDPEAELQEMEGYVKKAPLCRAGYFACATTIMASTTDEILIRKCEAARRFAQRDWRWRTREGPSLARAYFTAIELRMEELKHES